MPWFGGGQSVKVGRSKYWVAEDGGRKKWKKRKSGSTGRLNESGVPPPQAASPTPPAGILKRSGRFRGSHPSFQFEDGMVPQEMAAAVPMPSEQTVNAMFSDMVDELGLSRELMFKLPLEKRWELYLSKQKEQQSTRGADPQPEFYIDKTSTLTEVGQQIGHTSYRPIFDLLGLNMNAKIQSVQDVRTCEVADREENLRVANELKTALRTQPVNFVLRFISQNGLENLLIFLVQMNNAVRNSTLHYAVVGCVKALMNSPDGRAHVLVHPNAITIIAQSLKTSVTRTKILVLEIVGALCLVPGGHKKVLTAMDHFKNFAVERIRFQTLIVDLGRSLDEPQDSANLQIAVLSFFNAVINYKAGQESLEFRMHLRHELLLLGILPITDRLRALNIAHLNRHLEIFELVRVEDERELAARLDTIHVDSNSLKSMIELLHRKTVHTVAHNNLLSVIYHCLLLPIDDSLYGKYWQLIDRLVQQVVLQQRGGVDPDSAPLPINVDNLIKKLLREDEVKAIQWEAEEVRKDKEKIQFQLNKKEWECDSLRMERDQCKMAMGRLRQRLNRTTSEATEAWSREQDMQERLKLTEGKAEEYRQRVEQLEARLRESHISTDDLPSLAPSVPGPPPPPPPPPPTRSQPPLPPPPPHQLYTTKTPQDHSVPAPPPPGAVAETRRNIPKPSQALKSFNWAKIPLVQLERTIWSKVDDSHVHTVMDLRQFEEMFSAYQRKETDTGSSLGGTLRRRSVLDRPKELSVIESKRAQNCSIVLSTLKMTNEEIRRVVMTMDKEEALEKDSVEQLLKYVPTLAERDLLNSHAHEMESFARPDRFLLEMSRVPRYSQRLKSLFFKKTLSDRLDDVRPKIEAVHYSCKELKTSKKLRKVLEVVLAFGNFMNRGNRGNASGFRLSSLNKMADTKSSSEPDINLLHYLVQTLESKFSDVLTLETDLPHIRKASKVDFKEVEKEFSDMQVDLKDLEHELEFQRRSGPANSSDLFIPVMAEFAADVRSVFAGIQTHIVETRTEFHNTLLFFGEDASDTTTEEFFNIFTLFLHSFNEAHVELIAVQKKKEEEEKRRGEMERHKQLTLQRRKKRQEAQTSEASDPTATRDSAEFDDKAELDDLIAVLKSGEYFSRQRGRRLSGISTTSLGGGAPGQRNSRVLEFSRERSDSSLVRERSGSSALRDQGARDSTNHNR